MLHIAPLKCEEIQDAQLQALIERAVALGVPDEVFAGIVARAPQLAKALLNAMLHSHAEGNVDHALKEIIRIKLARIAHDHYFAGLRSSKAIAQGLSDERIDAATADYDANVRFTDAEKLALRYAEQMYLSPDEVDAAFYAELKKHYSEAQIMELGAFIALHYGMQIFMRTLSNG